MLDFATLHHKTQLCILIALCDELGLIEDMIRLSMCLDEKAGHMTDWLSINELRQQFEKIANETENRHRLACQKRPAKKACQ